MSPAAGNTKTRREFIKQSAMAAGMLTLINACGQSSKLLKPVLDPDVINSFKKSFSGHIILPGDTEYEMVRRVPWQNPETDKHPAIIGQCNNQEDILRCVDFAHQHELEVAIRSGNHSFFGWGTCERGMVIDLSKMKGINIDPVKQTVSVKTGVTAGEMIIACSQYGMAPVLGECASVGAGLVLGGGLGWLSGKYGAACDNLVSASLVTADARIIKTNTDTNADLFWGIRGGGGNFGIATAYEYRLHPIKEVVAGGFSYPAGKAGAVLRFFGEFMLTAPDELQACGFLSSNGGKESFMVVFVYSGNLDDGEKLLDRFRQFTSPEQDWVKRRTYPEVYYNMAPYADDGSIPNPLHSLKGSYIEKLSDEFIEFILDRIAHPPPALFFDFVFDHYMHGEVCRIAPDATAFELRKPSAVHLAFGVEWKDPAKTQACMAWHNDTWEKLQAYSGGRIYSNYMSKEGEPAAKMVFGTNYARLAQLKKQYDPQNFFHRNQNVLPK